MSRIAKNPVFIPQDLKVSINNQTFIINSADNSLSYKFNNLVKVVYLEDRVVKIFPVDKNNSLSNALAGCTRAIINNMVIGLTKGFSKKLELVGVGYRAQIQDKIINLVLGFSHPVVYEIPEGITVEIPTQTEILIKGYDKKLVGQVASDIRRYRPPEHYKGKGIRYSGEKIELKETKKK